MGHAQICIPARELRRYLQLPQDYHVTHVSLDRNAYAGDQLSILVESKHIPEPGEEEEGQPYPELQLTWQTATNGKWRKLVALTVLESRQLAHDQRLEDETRRLREMLRDLVAQREQLFVKRDVGWEDNIMDEITFLRAKEAVGSLPV